MPDLHEDDHPHPDPVTPRKPSPGDGLAQRLKQLAQEAKNAALEAQLAQKDDHKR